MKKNIYPVFFIVLLVAVSNKVIADQIERAIQHEVIVNADVSEVYKSWTTPEGIKTFFAPECEVELKLFGKFHIYFSPENPVGTKGAEDEMIISFQKNKMLSFTWGFPPVLPDLRNNQKTIVVLRFEDLGNNKTKVVITQSGWGEGKDWDKGYEYFNYAWKEIVLKRLVERFENGPVDWEKMEG